jgi:hypothetical protein
MSTGIGSDGTGAILTGGRSKTFPWDVAPYQGIQLGSMWCVSLDYINHQTSLTADQARIDPDGQIRFVISERNPGVANWLELTRWSSRRTVTPARRSRRSAAWPRRRRPAGPARSLTRGRARSAHRYALADFGLTAADVDARFGALSRSAAELR